MTLLKGGNGYRGSEGTVIYSVIKRNGIHSLKSLVAGKDPAAFVAIMDVTDVTGGYVGNQPRW